MILLRGIKNIVFDFGGVIYEINPSLTVNKLLGVSYDKTLTVKDLEEDITFLLYEKGEISSEEFRKRLNKKIKNNLTDSEIDNIWNLTLIKPFKQSYSLISNLKVRYNLALLSNTNEIHYNNFIIQTDKIFKLFDYLIYSFRIKMRKPDKNIFEYLLKTTGFIPEETLFLDDSPVNIEGAKKIGLKTFLVEDAESLSDIFHTV